MQNISIVSESTITSAGLRGGNRRLSNHNVTVHVVSTVIGEVSGGNRSTKTELEMVMGTYQGINKNVYFIDSIYIRFLGVSLALFILPLLILSPPCYPDWWGHTFHSQQTKNKMPSHESCPIHSSNLLSVTKSASLILAHSKQNTSNKSSRGSFLSCT